MEVFPHAIGLLQSTGLALGALSVFGLLETRLACRFRMPVLGLLLGAALLLLPSGPLDHRSALLAVSGAVGGPWAAAAASSLAAVALVTGTAPNAGILLAGLAGAGMFFLLRNAGRTKSVLLLLGLGVLSALTGWFGASGFTASLVTDPVLVAAVGLAFRVAGDRRRESQKQKKSQRSALRASEQSLRVILDSLHDAVFVYDIDGAIVDVNKKVLELYEIPDRERVLGTSPLDYTDPEIRPDPALDPRAEPAPGTTVSFEWHCRTLATGRKFTAQVDLKRIEYQGQPRLLAVVRDLSADKQAEEATGLTARIQTAARAAQMGFWDWDLVARELVWDETMADLYGIPGSAKGTYQTWERSLHPEDRQAASAAIDAALAGEREFDTEFRIVLPDGVSRHIRAFGQVIRHAGQAVRMVGINYDITGLKKAERELRTEKNLARQYLDVVEDLLVGLDDRSGVTLLNRKGCQVLGWEFADLSGKDWFKTVLPPEQQSSAFSVYRQILSGSVKPDFHESEIVTRSGERRLIAWHSTPIRDENNRITGILSSGDDITEKRKAQRQLDLYSGHLEELVNQRTKELETARDAANAANDAKSLFLANMSHEIRTPMNAVLGFAQLLAKEPGLSGPGLHKVSTIIKNGEHLLAIINDILEMSRIEAGRIDLKVHPFDLEELLGDLALQFGQRAAEKGLGWQFEKAAGLPKLITADPVRLRQILINLLGNAVKFTESGAVSFRAGPAETGRVVIEVLDTGVGIPSGERGRLFQPFERTRSGKDVAGGTGLGLAISRRFALLMGGDITIAETQGAGTCFRLEIDAPPAPALQPSDTVPDLPVLEDNHRGTLVLVADDLKSNRELLRGMLEPQGFVVIEAEDGTEALALVGSRSPRIVLMDLLMPGLDGYEATRLIRERHPDSNITIIGISASAFEQERTHFESSGLDGFLAKPFRFPELHRLVSDLTSIPYLPVPQTKPVPTVSDGPLPFDWARAFSTALAQGNVTKLRQLGESAQVFDSGLSGWISEKVSRYELDELRRFLTARTS